MQVPLPVRRWGHLMLQALPAGGKLKAPARLNIVAAGMLVHITDLLMDRCYVVDTGTSFSLVPHQSKKPLHKEPCLIGPNGHQI